MRLSIAYLMIFCQVCTAQTPVHNDGAKVGVYTNSGIPQINFETEVDSESVQQTIELLDQVTSGGAKAVILVIDTPGGSVSAGWRLINAIEESPIPVICVVNGEADSMGASILEACQVRIITKRSSIMIHEVAVHVSDFGGHLVAWQNVAEHMRVINKALCEHIAKRMSITPQELATKIAGGAQLWTDWKQSLDLGLVDFAVSSVKEVRDNYKNFLPAKN